MTEEQAWKLVVAVVTPLIMVMVFFFKIADYVSQKREEEKCG